MTLADVVVLLWVGLAAAYGAARGLTLQLLSLAGLAFGAFVGSRIAPHLLAGGTSSPWVPVASLVGAIAGAFLLQAVATTFAAPLLRVLARGPARVLDAAAGAVLGGAVGLTLAWLVAVVALQQPALGLRDDVQSSAILPRLVREVPPEDVLNALGRFDPLPLVGGLPGGPLPRPDPSVSHSAGARAAKNAVVKVLGTSCGLGVEGSGWVVGRGLVATNVHVVTGEHDTHVLTPAGSDLRADVAARDERNDVAILRVPGLRTRALAAAADTGEARRVALLGYPGNGALVAAPGSAGPARRLLTPDASGRRPTVREVVPLRGRVRHGDSGGPVVDARGRVVAMMYAATRGGDGGLGIPVDVVLEAATGRLGRQPAGPCAR